MTIDQREAAVGRCAGGSVLSAFARAFRTPDLRRKLLFTVAIMAVFRLGSFVPLPGVSYPAVQSCISNADAAGGPGLINLFSGGGGPPPSGVSRGGVSGTT